MSTGHLPAAFAVMFAMCCPTESAQSSVTPRSFDRGIKRSDWPSGWISAAIGPHEGYLKECHLTILCVERYLVMPAPLRAACDGFLHGSLGGKVARMAVE